MKNLGHLTMLLLHQKKHPKRDYFYSQIDKRQSVIKLMNDISFPFSYKVKKICKEFVKK